MSNDPNKIQVDWTKVKKSNKHYCRLCSKEIIYDGREPLPLNYSFNDNEIYYCSEHADVGSEIIEKFIKMKNMYNENYVVDLLTKIENQHKSSYGDWYIKFRNINNYGREAIHVPILKDNKPIGFISDVDSVYITGRIWGRYIPIIEEVSADNKRSMSFEIRC